MNEKLIKLAATCETATGSLRVLDFEIHIEAIEDGIWPTMDRHGRIINPDAKMSDYLAAYRSVIDSDDQDFDLPRYTASLDAALTLVPEGYDYIIEHTNGGLTICARVGHNDPDKNSWGETPALALCAAALRARAAL